MDYPTRYDVIVVGGGHAGAEAARAAARMGRTVLLLTMSIDRIGVMSCNPAIGGVGKGHIVREIDALGGLMGLAADATGIQFRRLNSSKGPAVRARRCQSDKARYAAWVLRELTETPGLAMKQAMVTDLVVEGGRVMGVRTRLGVLFGARAVVLTTGTFLSAVTHVGEAKREGGRAGEGAANALTRSLMALGLDVARLKTGTVPRLAASSLDLAELEVQPGEAPPPAFSFHGPPPPLEQRACWVTHTNERTHAIIRANLHRSPIFSGEIEGRGPRYCPSIEDKVVRFAQRASHRIFLEPEGLDSGEIYPNGISTSLPFDVQLALVRSIAGCGRAEITRPGYAVEYAFVDPQGLDRTLAVRGVPGLYLAGQINGTTGYEEAAGQGILAGINAACHAGPAGVDPFVLDRAESYIGVMVDDLTTRGCTEPYRMFTSRAEYRLLLREDNADQRLTARGRALGLVGDEQWRVFGERWRAVDSLRERMSAARLTPTNDTSQRLSAAGLEPLAGPSSVLDLSKRPQVGCTLLRRAFPAVIGDASDDVVDQVVTAARYEGYVRRQQRQIERHRRLESLIIPAGLDYAEMGALSCEVRQALDRVRPETVGQASRMEGVTPAAISVLLVHLKRAG